MYYLTKELSAGKIFFKGSTSQLLPMDLSFLGGVVLPAETFVSHLHNGETFVEELEKRNSGAAGRVLAEIWDKMEIHRKTLIAEYVSEGVECR